MVSETSSARRVRGGFRSRSGQSTVEYGLYISVIAVAMAVAAYAIVGPFEQGFQAMSQDATAVFDNARSAGSGELR